MQTSSNVESNTRSPSIKMLSDALEKTAQEVMRQSQNGTHPISLLAERLCMLLRITALQSDDARSDVEQLRMDLEPFIPETCVLDAIFGHILSILHGEKYTYDMIEKGLDSFLEQVRDAESEMTEQLSSLFNAGDHVLILSEREGGYVEASLKDAADGILEEDPSSRIHVTVIAALPDHEDLANKMTERLGTVTGITVQCVSDAQVTRAMQECNKVVLSAIALDVDDGSLCYPGSALICSAANRQKVPVVLAIPKHRILPVGRGALCTMTRSRKCPGKIWEYHHARDDRERDAISVIAPAYDLIQHQRCEMIVTEFGGYATEYVRAFAPCFDDPAAEEEQE